MPHAMTRAVSQARTVLLTTPDIDGDAVGSIVALALALHRRWRCRITVACDEPLPDRYAFLVDDPHMFQLAAELPTTPFDLALVLDGEPVRLGETGEHYRRARRRGLVDHHKTSVDCGADVMFLDPECSSTAEMVLRLCDHWGVRIDATLAAPIWAGMVFDTSVFRYRLTRPATLRNAARLLETGIDHARICELALLQQSLPKVRRRGIMINKLQTAVGGRLAYASLTREELGDAETGGLVDDLVFIEGVEIGALLIDKGEGRIRLSVRSRGAVDVALLARSLTPHGGGHARAAGATLQGPLPAAVHAFVTAATAALMASSHQGG